MSEKEKTPEESLVPIPIGEVSKSDQREQEAVVRKVNSTINKIEDEGFWDSCVSETAIFANRIWAELPPEIAGKFYLLKILSGHTMETEEEKGIYWDVEGDLSIYTFAKRMLKKIEDKVPATT